MPHHNGVHESPEIVLQRSTIAFRESPTNVTNERILTAHDHQLFERRYKELAELLEQQIQLLTGERLEWTVSLVGRMNETERKKCFDDLKNRCFIETGPFGSGMEKAYRPIDIITVIRKEAQKRLMVFDDIFRTALGAERAEAILERKIKVSITENEGDEVIHLFCSRADSTYASAYGHGRVTVVGGRINHGHSVMCDNIQIRADNPEEVNFKWDPSCGMPAAAENIARFLEERLTKQD